MNSWWYNNVIEDYVRVYITTTNINVPNNLEESDIIFFVIYINHTLYIMTSKQRISFSSLSKLSAVITLIGFILEWQILLRAKGLTLIFLRLSLLLD